MAPRRPTNRFACLLSLLALTLPASAAADGVAYRVADLRSGPATGGYFSTWDLAPLPTGFLLAGYQRGIGEEPYFTNGVPGELTLLRNIGPGEWSSFNWTLGRVGGVVLFSALDPATGRELWRTNGTAAGTWLVADIASGFGDSMPSRLGDLGGTLLFCAWDREHGSELWRSDGTAAGTALVADIAPGPESSLNWCEPGASRAGKLYFSANDGVHGPELWVTDGTAGGTIRLTDVAAEYDGLLPRDFVASGDRMYFSGESFEHGRELWSSDGTAAGTGLVVDLRPGPQSSYAAPWAAIGEFLVFGARDSTGYGGRIYRTDGTSAGTIFLSEVEVSYWEGVNGRGLVGGRIVFSGSDANGSEPWVTDGTPAGTHLLVDLVPGPESSGGGWGFLGHDGLYFCASDADYREFLWRTDGTAPGTTLVVEMPHCSGLDPAAASGGRTLFQVTWWEYCEPHCEEDFYELWTTDGTAAGTSPLLPDPPLAWAANPEWLTPSADGIVFGADTVPSSPYGGPRPWRSDGTEEGTTELLTGPEQHLDVYGPFAQLPNGEVVLEGANEWYWNGLFATDGEGLVVLGSGGTPFISPHDLVRMGDAVFFAASLEGNDSLWRTDGTVAGTLPVETETDPPGGPGFDELTFVRDRLWFSGTREGDSELWETLGTPGTMVEHDLTLGESTRPRQITPLEPFAGSLAFTSSLDWGEETLYSFAPGGTEKVLLKQLAWDPWGIHAVPMATLGGNLFFFDRDAARVRELWRSDGTTPGTTLVSEVGEDRYRWNEVPGLVAFENALFFRSCDVTSGCELWTSDGSAQGTHLFADLEPGTGSSMPDALAPIGDRLYFSACRAATGCEPWLTDGTPAGTHRLANIAPGVAGSASHAFTRSGDLVYFAADDTTGTELWAMPVELFYDGFETGDVTRWSGVGEP